MAAISDAIVVFSALCSSATVIATGIISYQNAIKRKYDMEKQFQRMHSDIEILKNKIQEFGNDFSKKYDLLKQDISYLKKIINFRHRGKKDDFS